MTVCALVILLLFVLSGDPSDAPRPPFDLEDNPWP
jgi:hypothetical protein